MEICASLRPLFPQSQSGLSAQTQQFQLILPEVKKYLEIFLGKPTRASSPNVLEDFSRLPLEQQTISLNILDNQLAFLREAITNQIDPANERHLVRVAMNRLRLIADEDALEKVQTTDVVEIFDENQIQVYRSFSCFALCNYSIAELATYPWFELYDRPSWVKDKLMELGMPVMIGQKVYAELEDKIPVYAVTETKTEERETFLIQEKFLARMLSSATGKSYVLSAKRIKPIEVISRRGLSFL